MFADNINGNYNTTNLNLSIEPSAIGQNFQLNLISNDADEAMLSFIETKKKILDNIQFNIQHYSKNDWTRENHMKKMFSSEKPLVSIRSGSKSILKFSISPAEVVTNEQKVACLRIIGRKIINNVYDKAIEEALLKEFQKRKAKKKTKEVLIQHPIEEKSDFIQTAVNSVEEPKTIKKTINQPNWQNSYSF